MELAGTLSGLWSYPQFLPGKMPIFISFTWVLNVWAVCCLALVASRIIGIPEINLCESFVESDDRERWFKRTSEESMLILKDCESILKTISEDLALEFDRNYIGITEKGIANNFIRLRLSV